MGPPEQRKAVSKFPNGPSSFFPIMLLTALNGPIGPSKASIDVHGWAQHFPTRNVSDCFEWARRSAQSQPRCLRMGPGEVVSDCFEWACRSMERRYRHSRMGPVVSFRLRFRLL